MAHEKDEPTTPDIIAEAEALAQEAEGIHLFGTLGFKLAMLETEISLGLKTGPGVLSEWRVQRDAFLKERARIKGPSNP
ncbi:MAG: hypothetical protein HY381_02530 [Candidatus Chisholmbacteria bacterium]|nr:hypothetical protein [Candidatus Chisholmbacteria bacterium]